VYRVLTQFESAGIVARHHFEGGTAVFELNEASTTTTSSALTVAGSRSSAMTASKNARKKSPRGSGQARRPLADFARPLRARELPLPRGGWEVAGAARSQRSRHDPIQHFAGVRARCVRSRWRRRASVRSPRPLLHRPAVRAAYGSGPSR
jgi:hypothetical protein